jgi:hypothetical protein
MNPTDLLSSCLLAMLLGLAGQGFRAAAGLKKQADEAAAKQQTLGAAFDGWAFAFSLFIGALAGMAAFLGMKYGSDGGVNFDNGPTVLGIVAAGYSGADFLESFAKKYLPK